MIPLESILTKEHRIDLIKSGQGHNITKIQVAIFKAYGINVVGSV